VNIDRNPYPPENKHQVFKDLCALAALWAFAFGFIVLIDRMTS